MDEKFVIKLNSRFGIHKLVKLKPVNPDSSNANNTYKVVLDPKVINRSINEHCEEDTLHKSIMLPGGPKLEIGNNELGSIHLSIKDFIWSYDLQTYIVIMN